MLVMENTSYFAGGLQTTANEGKVSILKANWLGVLQKECIPYLGMLSVPFASLFESAFIDLVLASILTYYQWKLSDAIRAGLSYKILGPKILISFWMWNEPWTKRWWVQQKNQKTVWYVFTSSVGRFFQHSFVTISLGILVSKFCQCDFYEKDFLHSSEQNISG